MSLEAQEAKIVTCKANGYELVRVYVDAGISGKRMDTRKELLAALASPKKGMALVSYSLSRLARSTKHLIEISELVSKKKGDLVSLTEKIDTTTPMGEMMFTLMAGIAQLERRMISDRTSTALQHKKRTRQKYTNQTPYGFEAIEGRLVEAKQEAEIVAEIQAARSSGATMQAIANNLNRRGIPTKTGKQWQPATIHLMLKRSSLVNQSELKQLFPLTPSGRPSG